MKFFDIEAPSTQPGIKSSRRGFLLAVPSIVATTLLPGCQTKEDNPKKISLNDTPGLILERNLEIFLLKLSSPNTIPWRKEKDKKSISFYDKSMGEYTITLENLNGSEYLLTISHSNSIADFEYTYNQKNHEITGKGLHGLSNFNTHFLEVDKLLKSEYPHF